MSNVCGDGKGGMSGCVVVACVGSGVKDGIVIVIVIVVAWLLIRQGVGGDRIHRY